MKRGSMYSRLPAAFKRERFEMLLSTKSVKIERIVSRGQSTPPGRWLKGRKGEWVVLLKGIATLRFKRADRPIRMKPGDYVIIPAGIEHRVERTAAGTPTIWLAVHY